MRRAVKTETAEIRLGRSGFIVAPSGPNQRLAQNIDMIDWPKLWKSPNTAPVQPVLHMRTEYQVKNITEISRFARFYALIVIFLSQSNKHWNGNECEDLVAVTDE